VRSLASELGLDKDTIARALVRLREARLVVAEGGRFEHGAYRLTVPADVLQFTVAAGPLDRRQARSPEPLALQLVLLEAG
jgi:DNA-binding IclR family transcriptional regulator